MLHWIIARGISTRILVVHKGYPMKLVLAFLFVSLVGSAAVAQPLTFEDLQTDAAVGQYPPPPGISNAIVLIQAAEFGGLSGPAAQGFGQFMHQPSGVAVLTWAQPTGTSFTVTSAVGFNSIEVSYAASDNIHIIPLNADGSELNPFEVELKRNRNVLSLEDQQLTCWWSSPFVVTTYCGVFQPDGSRKWATALLTFPGTAYGLRVVGGYNHGALDDLLLSTKPCTLKTKNDQTYCETED